MGERWMTKWGPRRVRYEPPTLAEALDAAADMSPDQEQQIQLAADLMQLPLEDVRTDAEAIFKSRSRRRIMATIVPSAQAYGASHGQPRAPIVVERKAPRRILKPALAR